MSIIDYKKLPKQTFYLFIFLFSIIFLAFFLYVLVIYSPSGTDVYTHMLNINRMAESNSLTDFYQKSLTEEYGGYDYPFGLWYFGSIIIKITGLDIYTIVSIVPFILMIGCLLIFYGYAHELLQSRDGSILALIFLISMPYLSLTLLNFSAAVFSLGFLITVFYLCMKKTQVTNIFLILILVLCICISNTGTFVFLTFTALVFFFFRALLWKKFDVNFFILLTIIIFCYNATVQIFPPIQPHYIDKGYLIISTSQSIAETLHVDVIRQLGLIFFNTIFVSNDYAYAILWAGLIFAGGVICVKIRAKAEEFYKGRTYHAGLPIIGNLTNVSHGISLAPFWLGPVQSLLSVIGFFKIDSRGKCLALTLLITAAMPGSLQGVEGTGSLREISFIFLIIPVLAAAGFLFLIPKITGFSQTPLKKSLAVLVCLCIIVPLIGAPVVGRLYYSPGLTMSNEEKNNLVWLGKVGTPLEGAEGSGYRERMTLYANKRVPSIPSGSETKQVGADLSKIYFSEKAEYYASDLSSFQITYLIASDRTFKGMTGFKKESLKIDQNTMLDKIDSSSNFFGIYKIVSSPPVKRIPLTEPVYTEPVLSDNSIQDVGSAFIYENDYYKIKLSDRAPSIRYIGTKTKDQLVEGYLIDTLSVGWDLVSGNESPTSTNDLAGLHYSNISVSKNEIIYTTRIMADNSTQKLVILYVKFIFNEKTIKREITVANDMASPNRTGNVDVRLSTAFFMPMKYFEYHTVTPGSEKWVHKIIYPAADAVILDKDKFDSIYFNDGSTGGLFMSYGDSLPYPNRLTYRGSPYYQYGRIAVRSDFSLSPSEPGSIVQFFSIKKPADAVREIKESTSVSLYNYPDAIIPLVLVGQENTANWSGSERNFIEKIKENNINYTLAIPQSIGVHYNELKRNGITPSGFVSLYEKKTWKDEANLSKEIHTLITDYNVSGVMFSKSYYDFTTIKILRDTDMAYTIVHMVDSPSEGYSREGVRNPKFAYYDGERTNVVFLPATLPASDQVNNDYTEKEIISRWNETIKSVVDIGGVAVFLWNPEDFGSPDYLNSTMGFLEYAQSRGMTITTPDIISTHYQKLQNVSATVTKDGESVVLKAYNRNTDRIEGATYRIELPSIEGTCPYTIINGNISRYELKNSTCAVFASVDLEAGETKEILVSSSASKKQIVAEIPPLVHGENQITIKGSDGLPLRNVSVIIDSKYYQSDNKGVAKFSVSHGIHSLRIEKPGYYPFVTQVEVKARFYRLVNWFNDVTGRSQK